MLDFEKSLYEIKEKINSLKESQEKNDVDLQDEIDLLEAFKKDLQHLIIFHISLIHSLNYMEIVILEMILR